MRTDSNDDARGDEDEAVLASVEHREDDREECTLYPIAVGDGDERMTVWITALDGSFVGLEEMR